MLAALEQEYDCNQISRARLEYLVYSYCDAANSSSVSVEVLHTNLLGAYGKFRKLVEVIRFGLIEVFFLCKI